MTAARPWLWILLGVCFTACAAMDRADQTKADDRSSERQVLVMLRVAPPHFRPDVSYAGGYTSRVGGPARRRIAEEIARQHHLTIVDDWPMPALGVDCFVMEAAGNTSRAQLVEQLSRDPRVESAQAVSLFHVLAHDDPLYPLQPSAKLWHLSDLHKVTTGRGVRIAEIDTGVEVDHPDLAGRVSLARNFVDGRADIAESHGTAVAGIIAARADDGIGIAGIAPDAKLMALRACWQPAASADAAVCSSFTLAKALQFALDENTQVVNLSLGGLNDRLLRRPDRCSTGARHYDCQRRRPRCARRGFPGRFHGVLAVAGR